jgi:ubiquitin-conjugating enzyme E2 J2
MHTPSGRFQPSTRLCLSISDFHPKSFNPAWEVSTILIGLLSFMTSEEMTTGSVGASEVERKWAAGRSRWWNSTGGGSWKGEGQKVQKGNVKAGDGGAKFRGEWPELDKENWIWMKENKIDPATGSAIVDPNETTALGSCGPGMGGLRRPSGSVPVVGAVVEGGREGRSWIGRHKLKVAGALIFIYVLIARLLGNGTGGGS